MQNNDGKADNILEVSLLWQLERAIMKVIQQKIKVKTYFLSFLWCSVA